MGVSSLEPEAEYLTKRQVKEFFEAVLKPWVENRYGEKDKVALKQEWLRLVDTLIKEGVVHERGYRWVVPYQKGA